MKIKSLIIGFIVGLISAIAALAIFIFLFTEVKTTHETTYTKFSKPSNSQKK